VAGIQLFAECASLEGPLVGQIGLQPQGAHILTQRRRTHSAKARDEPVTKARERGVWIIPRRHLRELQDGKASLGNVGSTSRRDSGEKSQSLTAINATDRRRDERILRARDLREREV
jgi:hypothetical protein